jgi:DNA-directed RNA polymerase specialized sigma24 family protein
MSSTGSVTRWLTRLRTGDRAAVQALWERYFRRMVGLAHGMLRARPRRVADEEDAALSAFASFCRGAEQGRFPALRDRHSLWSLLIVITARKVRRQVVYEGALKRGGARLAEDTSPAASAPGEETPLEQIVSGEPTPEFAAELADQWQHLLDSLGDEQLRRVAVWKMEGYTNDEIAALLGRSPRSVERKLRVIRGKLEALGAAGGGGDAR